MRDERLRARDTGLLAVLGALVAGSVHTAWAVVQADVLDRLFAFSRELPWFSPLAYFLYLAAVAIPLVLLGRWVPVLARPLVQGAILGGVTALGMLLHVKVVHPLALIALAVGAGVQFGRWLSRNSESRFRLVRRATVLLVAATFVAGLPGTLVYRARQGSQVAALPPAPPNAPNIVLIILDAVRAANLGTYGYSRPTSPTIDRLGREGAVFEYAIASAPWTGPTHATLLTGRYASFTGVSYSRPLSDSIPTITEVLRANGYATGAFMGNSDWAGRKTNLDRAFIRYDDFPVTFWQMLGCATFTQVNLINKAFAAVRAGEYWRLRTLTRGSEFRIIGIHEGERNASDVIVRNIAGWVDGLDGRPFFAMVNLFDAHDPYRSPFPRRFNEGRRDIDKYDASISFADSMIGQLTKHFADSGAMDRTVFVITADHGELFGEHQLVGHGKSLHLELLRVPLVVRAPGRVPAGLRIGRPVSLRDIPATLLDLAGLPDPRITGSSLAALWKDPASAVISPAISEATPIPNLRTRWPVAYGPMKSVVADSAHYIRRGDGEERVYAFRGDTAGRGDLTSTEMGTRAIDSGRVILARFLGEHWADSTTKRARPR